MGQKVKDLRVRVLSISKSSVRLQAGLLLQTLLLLLLVHLALLTAKD